MNKTAIKNFAIWARRKLISDIIYKAGLLGINENGISKPLTIYTEDIQFVDVGTGKPTEISSYEIKQRNVLIDRITEKEDTSETAQIAQNDVKDVETVNSTSKVTEDATSEATDAPEHDNTKVSYDKIEKEEKLLPDGVTVQSLHYMSGCTLVKTEPNGKESYYKFSAEEEWAVDEETGANTEKMDSIREALWDKLNFEIDSQIEELFDNNEE